MLSLFGNQILLANQYWGLSFEQLCIRVIIIFACIAVVYLALQYFGVELSPFIKKLFIILIVAFCCIVTIKILSNME